MPMFWKFKAWLHHWTGKLIWLAFVVAIVLVCVYLRGPIASVWKSIYDAMGF